MNHYLTLVQGPNRTKPVLRNLSKDGERFGNLQGPLPPSDYILGHPSGVPVWCSPHQFGPVQPASSVVHTTFGLVQFAPLPTTCHPHLSSPSAVRTCVPGSSLPECMVPGCKNPVGMVLAWVPCQELVSRLGTTHIQYLG